MAGRLQILRRIPSMPGLVMATALCLAPVTGHAAELGESLALDPPTWDLDGIELKLGGFATGAGYTARQSDGPVISGHDETGLTGQIRANIQAERTLDNGIQLGARANVLLLRGTLSDDRYGNDTIERVYFYGRMAYGTLEIGQQNGVGAQLGLTGPRVDPRVSLDDPDTTFFEDPSTNERFDRFFRPFSAVASSSVAAKINYLSPRLLGLQLGLSFTPELTKTPIPFTRSDSGPNQQDSIWEAALSYQTFFDDLGIGGSIAYLQGYQDNETPGRDDLYDLAIGAQSSYTLRNVKLSLGGGYRESNAYGFRTNLVFADGNTALWHLSFMGEDGPWRAGVEYSDGDVDGPAGRPDYAMNAYQAAIGYRVNDNLDIGAGWQWYDYDRNLGVFYNGDTAIDMDAGFITLNYGL